MVAFALLAAMTVPFATTTFTILRAPEQDDAYPDIDPVYEPIATGVRGHLEIMPRRIATEEFVRNMAMARFTLDPSDVVPFDYLRDERTGKLWRIEWCELRGWKALAHVAGQVLDVAAEVGMAAPLTGSTARARAASTSSGRAAAVIV
jgi:hypothetical protein